MEHHMQPSTQVRITQHPSLIQIGVYLTPYYIAAAYRIFKKHQCSQYQAQAIGYATGLAEHLYNQQHMKGDAFTRSEAIRSENNYWRTVKPWQNAMQKFQSAGTDYLPSRKTASETAEYLVHRLLRHERAIQVYKCSDGTFKTPSLGPRSTYFKSWLDIVG